MFKKKPKEAPAQPHAEPDGDEMPVDKKGKSPKEEAAIHAKADQDEDDKPMHPAKATFKAIKKVYSKK